MGSRPFRCKYRPFRDSDEEVEVEWFPAAEGALPLGMPSNITNPFWERDQFEYTDGDLPLSTVVPTGKPVARPGTGRGHVCGSEEDFREGGRYEPDEPPVVYGQQGLPQCCGAPVVGAATVVDGGRCGVASPIVPGNTCATATEIPLGEWLTARVPAGQTGWLSHQMAPTPPLYDLLTESISGDNACALRNGTCAGSVSLGGITFGDPFFWGNPSDGTTLFVIVGPTATDTEFRIRVEPQ